MKKKKKKGFGSLANENGLPGRRSRYLPYKSAPSRCSFLSGESTRSPVRRRGRPRADRRGTIPRLAVARAALTLNARNELLSWLAQLTRAVAKVASSCALCTPPICPSSERHVPPTKLSSKCQPSGHLRNCARTLCARVRRSSRPLLDRLSARSYFPEILGTRNAKIVCHGSSFFRSTCNTVSAIKGFATETHQSRGNFMSSLYPREGTKKGVDTFLQKSG